MTEIFRCGDNAALTAYLYDDCEPDEREAIAAHLSSCQACTAELGSMRATRKSLAGWAVPETTLGFQITRAQVAGPRLQDPGPVNAADDTPAAAASSWWRQPLPAWAQMAAAVVIFGVGVATGLSNGRQAPAAQVASQEPATRVHTIVDSAPVAPAAVSANDLAALETRLRAEMSAEINRVRTSAAPRTEDAALRRVQTLIDKSEERQRQEMALRTAEIVRDFDMQRRLDMANVQRSMGQMDAWTAAQVRDMRSAQATLYRVGQSTR